MQYFHTARYIFTNFFYFLRQFDENLTWAQKILTVILFHEKTKLTEYLRILLMLCKSHEEKLEALQKLSEP